MADKKKNKTQSGSKTNKQKQAEKKQADKRAERKQAEKKQAERRQLENKSENNQQVLTLAPETEASEVQAPKERKNDKAKGIVLFVILLILFAGTIYLGIRFLIPHSGWHAFEKSDLYQVFDNRGNEAYFVNPIEEPYVIIHADLKDMDGLEDNYQVWDVLKCSEGPVTKKNLNKMKTIIICESGYDVQNYNKNGLSDGEYGYSEYVKIYALDVETGGYYVGDSGETLLDEMEATPLPVSVSTTPKYKYRESSIVAFVEENLESWFAD